MLAQVGHERVHGVGDVGPQSCVGLGLVGVGVKSVVRRGRVKDPGAETGQVGLYDVLHVLPDGGGRVLHIRRVLVWSRRQDVRSLQRVGAGLMDVVHHSAGADGWGVHAAEDV